MIIIATWPGMLACNFNSLHVCLRWPQLVTGSHPPSYNVKAGVDLVSHRRKAKRC